jgi:hypothetical protein
MFHFKPFGASFGLSIVVVLLWYLVKSFNRVPLPPGPRGRYPFLGMTLDMPLERPWQVFADWAEYDLPNGIDLLKARMRH